MTGIMIKVEKNPVNYGLATPYAALEAGWRDTHLYQKGGGIDGEWELQSSGQLVEGKTE